MRKVVLILVCIGLLSLPLSAMAASEAEKQTAIDKGLAYLATIQNVNGSFGGGGVDYVQSYTGSALLAFLEEKANWKVDYSAVVSKGFDYLFSNASTVNIAVQPAGNPDSDGNGIGLKLYPGGINSRDTYVTGIAATAIAASGTPGAIITTGPVAGQTYSWALKNVLDYFAYGQSDPGTGNNRGGWRYYANYGNSDQSTTQWPVIVGLFGGSMGASYPGFVKSELAFWTNAIQSMPQGNANYTPGSPLGEMNETGALLVMQGFLGKNTSDPNVAAALSYINTHWKEFANSTWDGNFNHPYAMWAIYKGLELMIGLDNMTAITNLNTNPGDVDNPNHGWNWWEDYCEWLVNSQNANGSWNGYSSWTMDLATPWYINILAATKVPDGDGGKVPEPATMILLGAGLVGLAGYARKRMKK